MSTNEVEAQARTMGWKPKDQFTGPESNWLPAEEYLERGERIKPILEANNNKLRTKLVEVERKNTELQQQLAAAQEAIEGLKEFRSTLTKERAVEQKKEITTAIVEARREGDVDAEVELTEKLSEVTAALKEAEKPKPAVSAPQGNLLTPAAKEWMEANPWFGKDNRKTAMAHGITADYKASGGVLGTAEHFAYVDEELAKVFDPNAGRRAGGGKVEGSRSSGDEGGGTNGRTFADLDKESQEYCLKYGKKVVGPGRAYKTMDEWKKRYLETYPW